MKFTPRTFSKRFPPIECAIFCVTEPPLGAYVEYDPSEGIPSHQSLRHRGTAAALIMPDGHFWVGVTLCSPNDQFVKSVGRAKAIGRAYQAAKRSLPVPIDLADPNVSLQMKDILHRAIRDAKECHVNFAAYLR